MSNQGREPTFSSQPRAERNDSMDDTPPPYTYASTVTPPTPVAEEGPLTGTGRETGRMSPHTSPTAPVRTHQPERRDPMQLPSGLTPSLSRSHSTQTYRSSNAAPASAAPSTADPRGQAKEAIPKAQPEPAVPKQKFNIFCCCCCFSWCVPWLPQHNIVTHPWSTCRKK